MARERRTYEEPAPQPTTVKMKRPSEEYPAPHTADVHPDEVANYAAHGWKVAE